MLKHLFLEFIIVPNISAYDQMFNDKRGVEDRKREKINTEKKR